MLRVICNVLVHGNVVYFDKDGMESLGNLVWYFGFFFCCEENVDEC